MTRFTTFAALVAPLATAAAAAAILLAPATAAAEGGPYTCAPNAPGGDVLLCVPAAPPVPQATDAEEPDLGATLAPVYAPPVYAPPPPPPPPYGYPVLPPAEQTLAGRTHNWLAPTGEMLRAGDARVTLHQFIYAEAAYGLSDRFEINATAPIIPIFGSAGVRLGLTPITSNLRLVVGGSVWFPMFAEDEGDQVAVISGTVTAAYQTERLNLHGSLSLFTPVGDDEGDEQLGITSIGGTFKLGRKTALMAEYVQVIVGDTEYADRFALSAVGVKFLGAHTDVDVGYVFPHLSDEDNGDDNDFFGMPMLTVSHKF